MRYAECECPHCGTFKITFSNHLPKHKHLICPVCGCERCKVSWIDRAGINKEIDNGK